MSGRAPAPGRRRALFALALCGVFALASWPRIRPVLEWRSQPERHFSGDVGVASADSYYWLRMARELRDGSIDEVGPDRLRRHPDGGPPLRPTPLARAIAWLADALDTDVYRAGMLAMIPLASLFVFPLGFYFLRAGLPWVGLWGALVGSLSGAYLSRSFPYRIDTDGGNLLFAWLVPLCFAGFDPRPGHRNLPAAVASLLALHAFTLWYDRPAFALAYAACLGPFLLARGFGWRRAALWGGLALAASRPLAGVENLVHVLRARVWTLADATTLTGEAPSPLSFPPITAEMSELRRLPLADALGSLLEPAVLAGLALVAFAVFALRHPRWVIPLLPPLALALLGLLRSQRHLMYLGSFAGIGCGYAFTLAQDWATRHARSPQRARRALAAAGALLLLATLPFTAFFQEPRPRVTTELLASLRALRERLPPGATVVHTWGHGYLVSDVARAATLNDGGGPDPRVEQLLSLGIVRPDPAALHGVVGFLATHGRRELGGALERAGSYPALIATIAAGGPPPPAPLVVLFTRKMATEFNHSVLKATWSFEEQRGHSEGYDFRECRPEPRNPAVLSCSKAGRPDLRIDTEAGRIGRSAPVHKLLRIRDGAVTEEKTWPEPGVYLQLFERPEGPPLELHILHETVFASNFNQMFYLGRADPDLFRPLLDDFPVARAWEVVASPTDP